VKGGGGEEGGGGGGGMADKGGGALDDFDVDTRLRRRIRRRIMVWSRLLRVEDTLPAVSSVQGFICSHSRPRPTVKLDINPNPPKLQQRDYLFWTDFVDAVDGSLKLLGCGISKTH
jgi:hypothetical protein